MNLNFFREEKNPVPLEPIRGEKNCKSKKKYQISCDCI